MKRQSYYTDINIWFKEQNDEIHELYERFLEICGRNEINMERTQETFSNFVHLLFENCRFDNGRHKILKY
jgi:hypothetical protein